MTAAPLATLTAATPALVPGSPEFNDTVCRMAREYQAGVAEMDAALAAVDAAGGRIAAAFPDAVGYRVFRPSWEYGHRSARYGSDPADRRRLFEAMRRDAWKVLADRLGLRHLMAVHKRDDFDKQMETGDLPDITEEALVGVILGMVGQAQDFAREAAREVFERLRPDRTGYKTNSPFRVGRKVILGYMVERGYGAGRWRPTYTNEKWLTAIDNVFHLMDGRSILRDGLPPLVKAINEADPHGRGETDLFAFRCFQNGNLHLTFKRPDLVKQLNLLAAGEAVLGPDAG